MQIISNVIEFKNISLNIGGKDILRDISFKVNRGEVKVILGGSGSGKTTILKLILGLYKPTSGRIFVTGIDITDLKEEDLYPVRKKIGMVFQSSALFDSLNVGENVGYPLRERRDDKRLLHLNDGDIYNKVQNKLDFLDLRGTYNMMPSELSGGMKKRVAIARALISDPEIVLYDEPTTGLDPIVANIIVEHINKLRKTNVTSVVVTHELKYAFKVGDSFIMLKDGVIIYDGDSDGIKDSADEYVRHFVL